VLAAAAAFPPFWSLVLYGQITILILRHSGWLAGARTGRHYLAGVAFGLLALKPQFGIPLAAIVVACGEWRMLAGAVTSVVAQAAACGWCSARRCSLRLRCNAPRHDDPRGLAGIESRS
jgi:hypothetical protein